jgi:hypothetical protein
MVRNVKKGQKGNFFIQFSFSFSRFVGLSGNLLLQLPAEVFTRLEIQNEVCISVGRRRL